MTLMRLELDMVVPTAGTSCRWVRCVVPSMTMRLLLRIQNSFLSTTPVVVVPFLALAVIRKSRSPPNEKEKTWQRWGAVYCSSSVVGWGGVRGQAPPTPADDHNRP